MKEELTITSKEDMVSLVDTIHNVFISLEAF
jgi:hypothetical protein